MSPAAVAERRAVAVAELPPIACMAPVPWPRAQEADRVLGTRRRRVCVLPNGHGQFDVPCSYEWIEEPIDTDPADDLEMDF